MCDIKRGWRYVPSGLRSSRLLRPEVLFGSGEPVGDELQMIVSGASACEAIVYVTFRRASSKHLVPPPFFVILGPAFLVILSSTTKSCLGWRLQLCLGAG